MTINHKVTGTAASIPAGLAVGAAASLGLTLALSALTAWLILAGKLQENSVGYCAMGILLLSSAAGAWIATARTRRLRFQTGMASAAVYYSCLLAVTALFFGGRYQAMGVTALLVLCGSLLVILLVPDVQNRAGCRKRKKRT